jgi:hypothetical protein
MPWTLGSIHFILQISKYQAKSSRLWLYPHPKRQNVQRKHAIDADEGKKGV